MAQPKIAPPRELTPEEVDLLSQVIDNGNELGKAFEVFRELPWVDQRCLALAVTNIQTGLMWLRRSIEKPNVF